MHKLTVRAFEDADAKAAAQIFYDAVNIGANEFYTAEQRNAWASHVPQTTYWRDRLNGQITFVAVIANEIVGYMTLADDGYIDLAFVKPDNIGKGVAKALYDAVLTKGSELNLCRLYSDASFMAKQFFTRQGWLVVKRQVIKRNGIKLTNFAMEIQLDFCEKE